MLAAPARAPPRPRAQQQQLCGAAQEPSSLQPEPSAAPAARCTAAEGPGSRRQEPEAGLASSTGRASAASLGAGEVLLSRGRPGCTWTLGAVRPWKMEKTRHGLHREKMGHPLETPASRLFSPFSWGMRRQGLRKIGRGQLSGLAWPAALFTSHLPSALWRGPGLRCRPLGPRLSSSLCAVLLSSSGLPYTPEGPHTGEERCGSQELPPDVFPSLPSSR